MEQILKKHSGTCEKAVQSEIIEWERKLLDLVDNKESGYVDFAELIRETLSNREKEIAEAFRLYGQPSCANLNHPKKYRHDWSGNCPAEKKILSILKHNQ